MTPTQTSKRTVYVYQCVVCGYERIAASHVVCWNCRGYMMNMGRATEEQAEKYWKQLEQRKQPDNEEGGVS